LVATRPTIFGVPDPAPAREGAVAQDNIACFRAGNRAVARAGISGISDSGRQECQDCKKNNDKPFHVFVSPDKNFE
jgi:hypothetical protein